MAAPGLVPNYASPTLASTRPLRVLHAIVVATATALIADAFTPNGSIVPLWGQWSIGALTALAAAATAGVLAVITHLDATDATVHGASATRAARVTRTIDALAASIAYAIISGLLVALLFILTDVAVSGTGVSLLQATVGGAAAIAIVNIAVRSSARRTATTQAVALLMTLIAVGCLTAIVTTPDPLWWRLHFSRLGTFHAFSGYVFNGTLIATGALIVAFSLRVRREIDRLGSLAVIANHRRAARILPVLVALVGAHLAVVGLIPVNTLEFWHDRAATGMVLAFAGMLATSPWILRGMPRKVFLATATVAVVLVIGATVFILGIINLAGFEVIAFGLMFWWISVFAGCAERSGIAQASVPAVPERGPAGTLPGGAHHIARGRRIPRANAVSRPRPRVAPAATAERARPSAGPRTPSPSRHPSPARRSTLRTTTDPRDRRCRPGRGAARVSA